MDSSSLVEATVQHLLEGPDRDLARFDAFVKSLFFSADPKAVDCLCEVERCYPGALADVLPQLKVRASSSESALALYVIASGGSDAWLPIGLDALQAPISKHVKHLIARRALDLGEDRIVSLVEHRLRFLLSSASPVVLHLALEHLPIKEADLLTSRIARDLALPDSMRILALRWRADFSGFDPMLSLPMHFDSLDVQTNAAHTVLSLCLNRGTPDLFLLFDFVSDFATEDPPGQRSAAMFGLLIHALAGAGHCPSLVDKTGDVLVSVLLTGKSSYANWMLAFLQHPSLMKEHRTWLLQRIEDALRECRWDTYAVLSVAELVLGDKDVHPWAALRCVETIASKAASTGELRSVWSCCHVALSMHEPRSISSLVLRIIRIALKEHEDRALDVAVQEDLRILVKLAGFGIAPPSPHLSLPDPKTPRPILPLPASLSIKKSQVVFAQRYCATLECELRCEDQALFAVELSVAGHDSKRSAVLVPVLNPSQTVLLHIMPLVDAPGAPLHASVTVCACNAQGGVLQGSLDLPVEFSDWFQPILERVADTSLLIHVATVTLADFDSLVRSWQSFVVAPHLIAAHVPPTHAFQVEYIPELSVAKVRASHWLLLALVEEAVMRLQLQ